MRSCSHHVGLFACHSRRPGCFEGCRFCLAAGHEEVARLLLEAGAQCSEFTFDGDRCHYAALTPAIRVLLRQYEQRPPPLTPLAAALKPLAPADGGAGPTAAQSGCGPCFRVSAGDQSSSVAHAAGRRAEAVRAGRRRRRAHCRTERVWTLFQGFGGGK